VKEQPLAEPMAVPHNPTASTWNIANGLTVFRLLLVPVFVVVLFADGGHQDGWRWVASAVFAVASYTDRIDGQLARSRNLVTSFGKLVDPIADKALIGAALIGLSALDELPWWITVVILVRELGVTLLRFWVIRHGVIPASRGGKLKAFVQAVAIGLYLFPLSGWLATGRAVVMGLAVAVTVVTGIDYVARALTLRQTSERAAMKRARKAARRQ
jgi:CDP-diacylglycerol--glycerol-3-phosphate 3-phosphatidyltransferase